VNPLVQNGKKLVPSVTRVFSASKEIYVYLQAYKQSVPGSPPAVQPLFAFVSLYLGGNKILETAPAAVVTNPSSRLGTIPFTFSLGLDRLVGGNYDCQITILDPTGQKANFWRAPILIVP
jgi:hypothetical protein